MSQTILDTIFKAKQERVAELKSQRSGESLKECARQTRRTRHAGALRAALSAGDGLHVIAEIKRASPSNGMINGSVDVAAVAKAYERGGACAISVLTEEDHFQGSLDDLAEVRRASSLPVLRKDFIFDEYQIWEAAAFGADAILLIAAMLDDSAIISLSAHARAFGLDALVEVHSLEEMRRVRYLGEKLIGINNRDLRTFKVDLNISRQLIEHAPVGAVLVSESGLSRREDLVELHAIGFRGFLIGETLMRSGAPETELKKLIGAER